MKINQKSKTFPIGKVKLVWPQFLNSPDLLWRIWKLWPHWFDPKNLKGLALLINFHIWLLTIGPKLDFWRIFEKFGFAVFCPLSAVFHIFAFNFSTLAPSCAGNFWCTEFYWCLLVRRHQGLSAHTLWALVSLNIYVLFGSQETCTFYFGTEEV